MMRRIQTVLALAAFYGFVSAAKLAPKFDTDLGPVDYQCAEGLIVSQHETQCELYYHCGMGETPTHLYQCIGDYLYEAKFLSCGPKEVVDCGNRLRPFSCPSSNGNFPISPNACDSRYYICVNDQYSLQTCPKENNFDAATGTCSSTLTCPTKRTTRGKTTQDPFKCPEPYGQFPSPYTCTQFYICDADEPSLLDCPDGLYYNPILQVCDWPENVPSCIVRNHIGENSLSFY